MSATVKKLKNSLRIGKEIQVITEGFTVQKNLSLIDQEECDEFYTNVASFHEMDEDDIEAHHLQQYITSIEDYLYILSSIKD